MEISKEERSEMDHSRISRLLSPEKMVACVGVREARARVCTPREWPLRVCSLAAVVVFQTIIVASAEQEIRREVLPIWIQSRAFTKSVCAVKVCVLVVLAGLEPSGQAYIDLSQEPA